MLLVLELPFSKGVGVRDGEHNISYEIYIYMTHVEAAFTAVVVVVVVFVAVI